MTLRSLEENQMLTEHLNLVQCERLSDKLQAAWFKPPNKKLDVSLFVMIFFLLLLFVFFFVCDNSKRGSGESPNNSLLWEAERATHTY